MDPLGASACVVLVFGLGIVLGRMTAPRAPMVPWEVAGELIETMREVRSGVRDARQIAAVVALKGESASGGGAIASLLGSLLQRSPPAAAAAPASESNGNGARVPLPNGGFRTL